MHARILALVLFVLLTLAPATCRGLVVLDGFAIHGLGSVSLSGAGVVSVVVQPWDAKIVISGDFSLTGGSPSVTRQNLARLNPDGTLDAAFNPPTPDGPVRALALQPDPDAPNAPPYLLVGGSFSHLGPTERRGLARLSSLDGGLDAFNPATTATSVQVNALALQGDGRSVLVGGSFSELAAGSPSANLARVSVATPDPGAGAWSYTAGLDGPVHALLLQGGKLLVGGAFSAPRPGLVRLGATGVPDVSFAPPAPGGAVLALALQADGKLLVGGTFTGGPLARDYLARLTGDGVPDAGFAPAPNAAVRAIVVRPDGRIVVGGDFSALGASPAQRLAHLNLSGLPQTTLYPALDASVQALALQPDGKLVAGGEFSLAGSKPRTRLARFCPGGALDDDLTAANLGLNWMVTGVSPHPDGTLTFGGLFTTVQGQVRNYLARLKEDLTLVDSASFDANLRINNSTTVMAPLDDGGLIVAGRFFQVNGVAQRLVMRVDARGLTAANPVTAAFNANMKPLMTGTSSNVVLPLPKGSKLPDGTPLEDGLLYIAGSLMGTASPYQYLGRFRNDGSRDTSFIPTAALDGTVWSGALLPDQKLLVGTGNGKVLRLKTDGQLDAALAVNLAAIYSIALQPDGKLVFTGAAPGVRSEPGWDRTVIRMLDDVTVDESFQVETMTSLNGYTSNSYVLRSAPQTDGGMYIYGVFDHVRDATGTSYLRDCVARIRADGTVDPDFDLGMVAYHASTIISQMNTVSVQSDGKLILGGDFDGINGGTTARMVRFSYGSAAESLSVAADGTGVTWRRSGMAPELWRVWFEYCEDPDAPGATWSFLGYGQRTPGGWQLGGLNLAQYGLRANRYLRARGNVSTDKGAYGALVESVRLYYLDPPLQSVITVTADSQVKSYGDPDPALSYQFSPALNPGDSFSGALARDPGEGVGTHPIGQGTLALGSGYTLAFVGASLSITPKDITVSAQARSKSYGDPDPSLGYSYTPSLVGSDGFSGALSRAPGESAGSYPISLGSLSLSGNYTLSYNAANLTIHPRQITVAARSASKVYGDPDPTLGFDFSPALLGSDAFSGSLRRVAGESVAGGPYAIQQGSLGVGANYAIVYQSAPFGILPKNGSVTALAAGKTYGAADPALSITSAGLLPGDLGPGRIVLGASRAPGEGAGSYPITPSAGDGGSGLLSNYQLSYLTANFTIAKAPLVVRADDKSRAYRTPNPQLTASYRGFIGADNPSVLTGAPELTTAADLANAVGSYPIIASAGTLSAANYSFSPENGVLNVIKSCQEIVFPSPGERTYGDPPFTLNASACSGLSLNFASSNPQVVSVSGNTATIAGAGTVVLTASQAGSSDLESANQVSQTLVVHRAGQMLSFGALSPRQLGESPFTLTAGASSGLPVSFQSSDPTVAEVTGNQVTLKGAGTTVLSAGQSGDANYLPALPVSQPLSVSLESQPPRLVLSTLSSGAVTSNPVLNLAGQASDDSGIASLTVNGIEISDPEAPFSRAIQLQPGQNGIEVAARDRCGNRTVLNVSVTLDAAAPEIVLKSPADNSVVQAAQLLVEGAVTPGSQVEVAVNGAPFQQVAVTGGSFTWSGTLAGGDNTIEITARRLGRSGWLKRSVRLAPGQPALAVTEPAQDLRTEQGTFTIRGRAEAPASSVVLELDGRRYTPPLEAGEFSQAVVLERPGDYTLTAWALSQGAFSVVHRNIVRVARILGDLDGDGCVGVSDAAIALRVALGLQPASPEVLAHADVAPLVQGVPQPDGNIDAGDVLVILRKIVGLVDF